MNLPFVTSTFGLDIACTEILAFIPHDFQHGFTNHNTATNLAAYTCTIKYMDHNTCLGGYICMKYLYMELDLLNKIVRSN